MPCTEIQKMIFCTETFILVFSEDEEIFQLLYRFEFKVQIDFDPKFFIFIGNEEMFCNSIPDISGNDGNKRDPRFQISCDEAASVSLFYNRFLVHLPYWSISFTSVFLGHVVCFIFFFSFTVEDARDEIVDESMLAATDFMGISGTFWAKY